MTLIEVIGALFQIILWILNAWKEKNDDTKQKKSVLIQQATDAVIHRDATAYVSALDGINRMR